MKAVIQRVQRASVTIDGNISGEIGSGYLVFAGMGEGDDERTVEKYLAKIMKLRIFQDENGKTNLSIMDVRGELLLVSQFTLMAELKGMNRPSFSHAMKPDRAKQLYEYMVQKAGEYGLRVESGEFGADMKVELLNDGPFTIVLDETCV